MGHANQIGLEIALSSKKNVVILDGDGAIQMHMGNLILMGKYKKKILHIIFNNKIHESTGKHDLASDNIDYVSILKIYPGICSDITITNFLVLYLETLFFNSVSVKGWKEISLAGKDSPL